MLTIPVLSDSSATGTPWVRCVYFYIEFDETLDPWQLHFGVERLPFFMLGLSGILYAPADGGERFNSPGQISTLIRLIEAVDGRSVETSYIWLPSKLIIEYRPHRSDVFRIGVRLFTLSALFRSGASDTSAYLDLALSLRDGVETSPEETSAFRAWAREEITDGGRWRNDDEPPPTTGGGEGPESPPLEPPPSPPIAPTAQRRRRRLIDLSE